MSDTAIGQLIIFLTTIAGFIFTLYRENRNRRWDREDREQKAVQLAAKVEAAHTAISDKIDENTMISREAFKEANDVNRKIATLTEAVRDSGREPLL